MLALALAASQPALAGASEVDSLRTITLGDSMGVVRGVVLESDSARQHAENVKKVLEMIGRREVEGAKAWQRRKNPRVAMLSSALLPGLGQIYNGRRIKVAVAFGALWYYGGEAWMNWKDYKKFALRRDRYEPGSVEFIREERRADFFKEEARTFLWWTGAVWLIVLLDSWIDAHLYDVRAYTPPAVDEENAAVPVTESTQYLTFSFSL